MRGYEEVSIYGVRTLLSNKAELKKIETNDTINHIDITKEWMK